MGLGRLGERAVSEGVKVVDCFASCQLTVMLFSKKSRSFAGGSVGNVVQ